MDTYSRQQPAYVYQQNYRAKGGSGSANYPFGGMQATGALQILMGLGLIAVAIVSIVLPLSPDFTPNTADGFIYSFMFSYNIVAIVMGILAIIGGSIGCAQNRSKDNLEGLRNAYQVLCTVSALVGLGILGYFLYLFLAFILNEPGLKTSTWYILYIVMLAINGAECLLATIGGSISCCCAPKCCTPLHEQTGYSYEYVAEY